MKEKHIQDLAMEAIEDYEKNLLMTPGMKHTHKISLVDRMAYIFKPKESKKDGDKKT